MTSLFQFGKHKNYDALEEFHEELIEELLNDDDELLEDHELTVEVALGAAATTLAEAMVLATKQQKPEVLDKIAHSWILLSQALDGDVEEKNKYKFGFNIPGDDEVGTSQSDN